MSNKYFKQLLCTAVLLVLGASVSAVSAATTNNNFTMIGNTGGAVGGTNDVVFNWDCSLNTDVNTAVSNATLSSTAPFFGIGWTAYQVKIYGPGNYTISTADTPGGPGCPGAQACAGDGGTGGAPGTYNNVAVGANQIMAHMKFAWGGFQGIDVVNVWETGSWSVLNPDTIGDGNPIWTGIRGTYSGPTYSRTSIDWNGDGFAGAGMLDGPFNEDGGFNANFNVSVVGGEGIPEVVVETQLTASETSTAGGGCTMTSSSPISAIERADWWIVAGFLAWLGAIRKRVKHQTQS